MAVIPLGFLPVRLRVYPTPLLILGWSVTAPATEYSRSKAMAVPGPALGGWQFPLWSPGVLSCQVTYPTTLWETPCGKALGLSGEGEGSC